MRGFDPFAALSGTDPMLGGDALDLLGDDDTDELLALAGDAPINALPANLRLRQTVLSQAAAGAAIRKQLAARTRQQTETLSRVKDQPGNFLGLDSLTVAGLAVGAIPAGAAVNIQAQADRDCRPFALQVDPTNAGAFQINGIQVAGHQIWYSPTGVPAFAFTPQAPRQPFRSPILRAATPAIVAVTNFSPAAARFMGVLHVIGVDEA